MGARILNIGIPKVLKFGFPKVQKQYGRDFVWFSNGTEGPLETKLLASLDHFIYKHNFLYKKTRKVQSSPQT